MGEVIYEKTLTMDKLQGRKDCEIRFVYHDGRFSDLTFEAYIRNIKLVYISLRKFYKETCEKEGECNVDG